VIIIAERHIYFSADYHLNHTKIILYRNRDYPNLKEMNTGIIHSHNNRLTDNDIMYHIGDFAYFLDTQTKLNNLEAELNGTIIHINGNHDNKKVIKTGIGHLYAWIGKCRRTLLVHDPDHAKKIINTTEDKPDLVLCGHVHTDWLSIEHEGIPFINVGWDIWHGPVSVPEISKLLRSIESEGIIQDPSRVTEFKRLESGTKVKA